MRERPILFNGAMVRAILAGQKTQTRRVLKMPHGYWETSPNGLVPIPAGCPFGQPGDRLWVRETWSDEDLPPGEFYYRADALSTGLRADEISAMRWKPSIHMPRWACRLMLEITAVRMERLQAISARDCQAEGIRSDAGGGFHVEGGTHYSAHPDESFASLWTSTGGDWDSNPWVWVIEFNRVEVANG